MKSPAKYIKLFVSFLFIFGLGFIQAPSGLSQLSMRVMGIFIGTIILWLGVSITWPSLLCIFALALSGLYTANEAIAGSIGNWTATFVLFSAAICYVLQDTGFLRRCAIWFITRPICKNSPWIFIAMLFLAPLIIGSVLDPISVFVIFIPIMEQIFVELGYKKGEREPKMITLGVLSLASVSTLTTPISHPFPIIAMSIYTSLTGSSIGFLQFTLVGFTTALIIYAMVLSIFKFLFKPDMSRIKNVDTEFLLKDINPMSKREKISLMVFIVVVIIWMAPGLIGGILPNVSKFLSKMGTAIPAIIGFTLLCVIEVDGDQLADFDKTMKNGVPWGAWILVGATALLGSAVTNQQIGVTNLLGSVIAPVVSSFSSIVSVLIIVTITIITTNFITNAVTVTLVGSIVIPLTISGVIPNISTVAITVMIGMGSCIAMATPPSTAPAAMAVGTGWLDTVTMFKWGMLIILGSIIILTFISYPLATILL